MNVTGMQNNNVSRGVCVRVYYILKAHFFRRYMLHTSVGRHSTSQQAGFPRTEEPDG